MIARTADGYRQDRAPATSVGLGAALGTIRALTEGAGWALWRCYQMHRTSTQLSALSDDLLKDIGLSRSTLISATMRRLHEEEALRRRVHY